METLRLLLGPIVLIHERAGTRLTRLAQIAVFGLWAFKLLLDPLWRLAMLPRSMYEPLGPLALLPARLQDWLLTTNGLTSMLALCLLFTLLALFRVAFLLTSVVTAFLLTLYSCLIRSFGPAVHTDIVLLLGVYAFAGFAWADALRRRTGRHEEVEAWASYPLITLVALLGTSYFLVGINRVVAGGLGVFTSDTMTVWVIDASLRGYYFNTDIGWMVPQWPAINFLLRAGLPVVTVLEILAPLTLVWPHFRWIFIPAMLSFHLLSLVFMNIFFFDDMLVYLLLIDWSRRYPFLARRS